MKGRNSTVVSVRLPDRVVAILAERANTKDMSIGEYIKTQIVRSVNATSSVNTTKPGDVVTVMVGKKMVEAVVPHLDADGHVIPEY